MLDVTDNNAAYYYHYDGLGSVVALSDSTGEVVEQYVYDVFGQPALQGSLSTVGNTEVLTSITTIANRRAMPFTMSESGTIQSVSIYHEGGTGNLILAVYDDSSGLPNTRLGVTESTPINGSAGWQTVELTSPVDVQEGQTIWLAWVFESNPGIRFEPGSPGRASSAQTWSGGMPESFGSSTTASYIYSIYATYTTEQEEAPELIGNPYMFTGRRFDIEIRRPGAGRAGLYYYRARYYNPHIGRFMQTDPVGYNAGINWYLYCWNNPLGWVDISGFEPRRPEGRYGGWERADGHPPPPYSYPYYIQYDEMACSATAVLNWWLTYDTPLPTTFFGLNNVYDTDYEAEKYVESLLRPETHNWHTEGIQSLNLAGDVAGNYTHVTTEPTAEEIRDKIDDDRAVMIGIGYKYYPRNEKGEIIGVTTGWHVVLVVPTPKDYGGNELYPYSVVGGVSPMPFALDAVHFDKWFGSHLDVVDEWLYGESMTWCPRHGTTHDKCPCPD